MDKVASSGNDEFYTPLYAIKPIVKYLKKGATIWCPFDTKDSFYVKELRKQGFKVKYSHIGFKKHEGDFFKLINNLNFKPDYIISNPPYSIKTEVLEALFNSPYNFAMLLGVVGIFESKRRFNLFKDNKFEIMYFDKRISYFQSYKEQTPSKNPPFSSVYICRGVLDKEICFETLNKGELR